MLALVVLAFSLAAQQPTRAARKTTRIDAPPHTINVGQTVHGALTRRDVVLDSDTTYAQAWAIKGRAGQTITIDLQSDAFDAFLFLRGPGITGGRDLQDHEPGGKSPRR